MGHTQAYFPNKFKLSAVHISYRIRFRQVWLTERFFFHTTHEYVSSLQQFHHE